MKIAYCILAHNNPEQLARLTSALRSNNSHCFVHIDAKSDMQFDVSDKPNVTLIKNRIPVYWGSFHIVQATLNTFKEVMSRGSYDYLVLLSGADYPIRSNGYIEKFFEIHRGTDFMSSVKMPGIGKTMDRVEFPWLSASTKTPGAKAFVKRCVNFAVKKLQIKHHLPKEYKNFTFYGGSAWVAFTRETAEFVLKFSDANKKFQKFFKHVLLPDESYFQTLLMNKQPTKPRRNGIIYTVWQETSPSPETIDEKDLPQLEKSEIATAYGKMTPLFARKFDPSKTEILDQVDQIRTKVLFDETK